MSNFYRGRGGGGRQNYPRGGGRGRGCFRGHATPIDSAGSRNEGDAVSARSSDSDGVRSARDPRLDNNPGALWASAQPPEALLHLLRNVDGCNYGQLRQLTGATFALRGPPGAAEAVTVRFLRIQPDPFAPGSQICITVAAPFDTHALLHSPQSTPPSENSLSSHTGKINDVMTPDDVAWRRVAAEDFVLRCVTRGLASLQRGGSAIQMMNVSQHVLPRSTVQLVDEACAGASPVSRTSNGFIRVFLRVKLPGHGRRIDSPGIQRILFSELLPVFYDFVLRCRHDALWAHVTSVSDQEWLRRQLNACGLVAFIADGAVLPRTAGDSDLPLTGATVIPFASPPSLSRSFTLPFSGRTIQGAGLRRGLTLIAGGGFHGKSTLLRALELGVYNHVPDDGRTFVVVDPTAVKIRAEDRRSVHGVNISPFIQHLPFRSDTTAFATTDASGSTSQAANIMEALELGSTALLLDEDTSATNFMYRDAWMERLVPAEQEPITAFAHRVQDLMKHHGVSILMVVGGSGQYFPMADVVLVMNAYHVRDATEQVQRIVQQHCVSGDIHKTSHTAPQPQPPPPAVSAFQFPPQRHFDSAATFAEASPRTSYGHGRGVKISGVGMDRVRLGDDDVALTLVEQLVEEGQLNAIAQCLAMLHDEGTSGAELLQQHCLAAPTSPPSLWVPRSPIPSSPVGGARLSDFGKLVYNCESRLRQARLELQTQSCYLPAGFTTLPRVFEIGAALNRLRTLVTVRR